MKSKPHKKQPDRIDQVTTYKNFIGGKFLHSESGTFFSIDFSDGKLAKFSRSSPEDVIRAVSDAQKGIENWAGLNALRRAQILYQVAETIQSRFTLLHDVLVMQGLSSEKARLEIETSIDRILYYVGWIGKTNQVFGGINEVSGSFFNYSLYEPIGIIGFVSSSENTLSRLISSLIPAMAGGNTCVIITEGPISIALLNIADIFQSCGMPSGAINILTGFHSELAESLASHMDVNALYLFPGNEETNKLIESYTQTNLKRILCEENQPSPADFKETPYRILQFQELKTVWQTRGI